MTNYKTRTTRLQRCRSASSLSLKTPHISLAYGSLLMRGHWRLRIDKESTLWAIWVSYDAYLLLATLIPLTDITISSVFREHFQESVIFSTIFLYHWHWYLSRSSILTSFFRRSVSSFLNSNDFQSFRLTYVLKLTSHTSII